eukprot:1196385-Prorocentrum_minimum.AAC.2
MAFNMTMSYSASLQARSSGFTSSTAGPRQHAATHKARPSSGRTFQRTACYGNKSGKPGVAEEGSTSSRREALGVAAATVFLATLERPQGVAALGVSKCGEASIRFCFVDQHVCATRSPSILCLNKHKISFDRRAPGLSPPVNGLATYTRPAKKTGNHGIGWGSIDPYSFQVPEGWDEVGAFVGEGYGGQEVSFVPALLVFCSCSVFTFCALQLPHLGRFLLKRLRSAGGPH